VVTERSSNEKNDSWSFHCSACGICCNSPPQLSLPELFRHQHLFVGSLAIRRVKRLRLGEQLGGETADAGACAAFSELAEKLLHPVEPSPQAPCDILLSTQGFDYPSLNRCPALGDDRRCAVHHDHKPVTCSVVPLEALVPDRLQHLVLAGRCSSGESHGTDCIVSGERAGFAPTTRHAGVVDECMRQSLALRRSDLAADKHWWGNAVFRLLQKDLFGDPVAVSRIPFDGFLTIAPAPVLMVLAEVSERCRARCIEFLDAQVALIEDKIRQALVRKQSADRPITGQLRAFAQSSIALGRALRDAPALGASRSANAAEIEAWLGLGAPTMPAKPDLSLGEQSHGTARPPNGDEISLAAARLKINPEALQTCLDAGKGTIAPGVTRFLHATVKPGGSACNLDCTYCYYLGKEGLLNQKNGRLPPDLLERFIVDYINSQDSEEIAFTWHGGEPTLLGIDYFRTVVELQKKHAPVGRLISNDLQTNGTLLDDDWCAFLAKNRFLVGLSIDGPRELHDTYRLNKQGASSFDDVFAAARRLKAHGIPFSTLTTVNRTNALRPMEVYRFLRDEVGTTYMQFIPCVEPRQFEKRTSGYPADTRPVEAGGHGAINRQLIFGVTDWSVGAEDWGSFLTQIFDEWQVHDDGLVKINLFETMFAQLKGLPALICTSSSYCGKNVAMEHDGRVYSCDHYVYPEYEIGNIAEQSLGEMVFSLKQLEFGLNKYNTLPRECRSCRHLKLCGGECPRTRILTTRPGEGRLSYLCQGWKKFFDHALPRISRTASH
jgi:uncharacterized protein